MIEVDFSDLSLAFDFVSSDQPEVNYAYICAKTGKIYWYSAVAEVEEEEELPEDLGSENYICVPHKKDLDFGRNLALDWVQRELPHCYEMACGFFRHRGAYGNLKDMLAREGALEKWHDYEAGAEDRALRKWASENGIKIVETKQNVQCEL